MVPGPYHPLDARTLSAPASQSDRIGQEYSACQLRRPSTSFQVPVFIHSWDSMGSTFVRAHDNIWSYALQPLSLRIEPSPDLLHSVKFRTWIAPRLLTVPNPILTWQPPTSTNQMRILHSALPCGCGTSIQVSSSRLCRHHFQRGRCDAEPCIQPTRSAPMGPRFSRLHGSRTINQLRALHFCGKCFPCQHILLTSAMISPPKTVPELPLSPEPSFQVHRFCAIGFDHPFFSCRNYFGWHFLFPALHRSAAHVCACTGLHNCRRRGKCWHLQ